MKKKPPVNLDLATLKFPITAISSILHRISGILLFLLIPLFLWGLQQSLRSPASFMALKATLSGFGFKLLLWVILSAVLYHMVAGIRHLLMDAGIGEEKASGRAGSKLVLVISAVLIALAGIWVW